jgi:diamine N-acetyltransferase
MQILQGKNLSLRAMEPGDIDLMYAWENDPETWQFSNTHTPFSKFHLEQYVLNSHCDIYTDKQLRLMIVDKAGNTVGTIDLFEFDPRNKRAGIGILIAKPFRKKGYASEAIDLVIDYCKKTIGLHQVFCNIAQNNKISIKLFQSKGFESVGIKKQWLLYDNKWLDEHFFQLILN